MAYTRVSPVPAGFYITSVFGPRTLNGVRGEHRGVDYGKSGGSGGQPVYAAQAGVVVYSGAASGFGGPSPRGWAVIDHPAADGGGTTVYGHIISEVKVGQRVTAGQRVGTINPDTRTNGGVAPHLHFEVHPTVWKAGSQIDPVKWLAAGVQPTATKPTAAPGRTNVSGTPTTATIPVAETKGTTVATADDIVKEMTANDPQALLYRDRESEASGKGPAGYYTGNIKKVLAEVGFLVTTYEKATGVSSDPDTEDAAAQRHLLGWVLYLAGSALDIRKRLKRIEAKIDALETGVSVEVGK